MRYSAVPRSAHGRIAFHHLHWNIFIAVECFLCFQTVLGNAVHSQFLPTQDTGEHTSDESLL